MLNKAVFLIVLVILGLVTDNLFAALLLDVPSKLVVSNEGSLCISADLAAGKLVLDSCNAAPVFSKDGNGCWKLNDNISTNPYVITKSNGNNKPLELGATCQRWQFTANQIINPSSSKTVDFQTQTINAPVIQSSGTGAVITATSATAADVVRVVVLFKVDVLTEESISQFKDVFSLFDRDRSGYITVTELGTVLRSLGQQPSEAELQEMIAIGDDDGNGTIDFPEFLKMMGHQEMQKCNFLKETFSIFDKNNDGFISPYELGLVLQNTGVKLSEDEIEAMIQEVDTNGDGLIDLEEFARVMKS
ncbi:uncharacterized protein LOC141912166 [Tubulanus polymorphus]|uniref:uncharacterized protein LOC141912166 n=1 Tax=Tubulanus polymorphus TaxID=672921 RepID=UPI003DA2BBDF